MSRVLSPRRPVRPVRPAARRPFPASPVSRAEAEGILREWAYVQHLVERVKRSVVNEPPARMAASVGMP